MRKNPITVGTQHRADRLPRAAGVRTWAESGRSQRDLTSASTATEEPQARLLAYGNAPRIHVDANVSAAAGRRVLGHRGDIVVANGAPVE